MAEMRPTGAAAEPEAVARAATLRAFWEAIKAIKDQPWGDIDGYFFIFPSILLFFMFSAYPLLRGLVLVVQDYRFLTQEAPFVGLGNFREFLFDDKVFWQSFGRSLWYSFLFFPVQIPFSLIAAILVGLIRNRTASNAYRVILYLPVVIPTSVAFLLGRDVFDKDYGWLNHILRMVFHMSPPPKWGVDPKWTIPMAVMIHIWKSFGADMLLFLIGAYAINPELYDASAVDGASTWEQIKYVTLPLLKPMIVLVLVLSAGLAGSATEFLVLFSAGAGFNPSAGTSGPQDSGLILPLYIYRVAFMYGDMRWGYTAAMGLALGIFSMLLSAIAFKLLRTERA